MHGSQAAALGGSLADVAATVCEHANARFVGESLVRVFNTNGSERDVLPCLDFLGALSGSEETADFFFPNDQVMRASKM